jgi:hypothetical protein
MALTLVQFASQFGADIQGMANILSRGSMLMGVLPIKKIAGLGEKHGSVDFEGGVGTRKLNAPFAATAPSTVSPKEERVIIAGGVAKTDTRFQSAESTCRANEIARKTRVVGRLIDHEILQGEGKTDLDKLVGFKDRLSGAQVIKAGTNGAALSLDMFHQFIDAVDEQGGGRVVLMPKRMCRAFKNELIAWAGGATVADLVGEVFTYEGVKIMPTYKNHDGDELLNYTETCGTSEVTASAYCFAPGTSEDFTGVQILMASNSIETIYEGTRDSQHIDVVEVAFGVAQYHPRAAARLYGITNT